MASRPVRTSLALSAGLALLAIAVAVAFTRSPPVTIAASSTKLEGGLASMHSGDTVCQDDEVIPRGTSAIRFAIGSAYGPALTVKAYQGKRVLTQGSRGNEWVGPTAVSVTPLKRTYSNVKVCVTVGTVTEGTNLSGGPKDHGSAATHNGSPLPGRTRIEYLRSGPKSWLTLTPSIAEHMGLGRAGSGTWIVFLLMALVAAIIAITSRTILADLK